MSCAPHSLGETFYKALKSRNFDEIALVEGETGRDITYGALVETSSNLAAILKKQKVTKHDVVLIISPNSCDILMTALGVFYVGAKLAFLNYGYTVGELEHFFKLYCPKMIFCTEKILEVISKLCDDIESVVVYDLKKSSSHKVKSFRHFIDVQTDGSTTDHLQHDIDISEDVAILMTSSGTTGFPKSVMLTHENIISCLNLTNHPEFINLQTSDVGLAYLPMFHLLGLEYSLNFIAYGGKLVVMEKFISDLFFRLIQRHKVSNIVAVPGILDFLSKTPDVHRFNISSLKDIIYGSDTAISGIPEALSKRLNCIVRCGYGMTEASAIVTMEPPTMQKRGSVGKISSGFVYKICDIDSGRQLGCQQPGEFRIKGKGIMKGYYKNDQSTRNAFDDDGFMKTGDVMYYDGDGFFYHVARLKEIIKYKAFQVSPGELEGIIMKHPGVLEVGVVGKPDERTGELPTALVVKTPGLNISEREIISYVAEKLSIQKHLHGGVVFVEDIPKNSVGKIDRNKLKEMLNKD